MNDRMVCRDLKDHTMHLPCSGDRGNDEGDEGEGGGRSG